MRFIINFVCMFRQSPDGDIISIVRSKNQICGMKILKFVWKRVARNYPNILMKNIQSLIVVLITNKKILIGFMLFLSFFVLSLVGGILIPKNYFSTGAFKINQPPNSVNILGTDVMGRDVLYQIFVGMVNSTKIGIIVGLFGTFFGAAVGFTSGYRGGILDNIIGVLVNVFLSIPSILLLVLLGSLLKSIDAIQISLIIALFNWAWPARSTRAQTLSLKERDFIYIAKLNGMNSAKIIFTEIMPHMIRWLGAVFIQLVLWGIIAESGISILGLGPKEVTLGQMLFWAYISNALYNQLWWWWGPVVVVLVIIFVSLYLMYSGIVEFLGERAG